MGVTVLLNTCGVGEDRLLDEVLLALASSGGAAVVTAAGTDAWSGLREAVARWFGRSEPEREQRELERLDRTAEALQTGGPDTLEQTRVLLRTEWQTRFAMALEDLDGEARDRAVGQLRALLPAPTAPSGVSTGDGGLAVYGDVNIRAQGDGAFAAGVVNGGVRMGIPPQPDPTQG